jgi:hypothetical protein
MWCLLRLPVDGDVVGDVGWDVGDVGGEGDTEGVGDWSRWSSVSSGRCRLLVRVLVFGSKGFSITIAILSFDESPKSLFLSFSIPFPFDSFLPSFLPSSLPSPRDLPRTPLLLG